MPKKKQWPIMRLITQTSLSWKRYLQKEVLPYGITLKQRYVLNQLEKKGMLYPAEIADMLYCDRPTATIVIKNMEKQGWIKRELDTEDSRRIRVSLEKAGQKKLKQIGDLLPDNKAKVIDPLSCFTNSEKEQLSDLLGKLNMHIQKFIEHAKE